MDEWIVQFALSLEDSVAFADLCGDYNPLHIDPVVARRLRFGSTVTHGIHLFARTLDELAARKVFSGRQPTSLAASFDNPVVSGALVEVRITVDGDRIAIVGAVAGRRSFSGNVELRPGSINEHPIEDAGFTPARPQDLDFPPLSRAGAVPLKLGSALLARLLPSLSRLTDLHWLADLLATTQIVGMHCPGMHSIYSSFRLRRADTLPTASSSMQYSVDGVESRHHLLRIRVAGASLAGAIEAFSRARPVAQRTLGEVAPLVTRDVFAGHRVLIVGGSRGLGELSAKILAAGGADVTITYARGKEDAERICAEARALGRACAAQCLDVKCEVMPDWLVGGRFSHVHYFASPLISRNVGSWNETLFEQFVSTYVSAFARLVEHVMRKRTPGERSVRFLYPSSTFATHAQAGFMEYAVAKAAGEALCDHMQARYAASFLKPRLPRLRTDQTSALIDIGAVDPFPIMLNVVRELHA